MCNSNPKNWDTKAFGSILHTVGRQDYTVILVLTAFQNAALGSQKDIFLRGLEVDHALFDFLSAGEERELATWHSSRSWSAAEGNLWRPMVATFLFLRGTVWQFATFGAF